MSLFENQDYRWRETCFVLLRSARRPQRDAVVTALRRAGSLEVRESSESDSGQLDSLTVVSAQDFSGMDITYVDGDDVDHDQLEELCKDLARSALSAEDREKLSGLRHCDARFDVLHFEKATPSEDGEEFLDPGTLLTVLQELAALCGGIGVDPQSGTIV